jgi:membrane-anchored protein YejM (alkaline phosphatase superfamily)
MKSLIVASLAVWGLFGAAAHAACVYPKAPTNIPDGSTATKEQMVAAKQDFTRYNDEMTAYLNCIKLESDDKLLEMSKDQPATEEEKKALEAKKLEFERQQTEKHNAAVDEVSAVVERFNEQVRAYKKKQSG